MTAPVTLTANSTISVTGISLELTNVISGGSALTKTGSGILKLDEVNMNIGAPPTMLTMAGYSPGSEAGALRSMIDLHADQVQMSVDEKILASGAMVSSPEQIAQVARSVFAPRIVKGAIATVNGEGEVSICGVDDKGDTYCGGS